MFDSLPPPAPEPGRFRAILKLVSLGVLVLLLLVPVSQLLGLVRERKSRQDEVRSELARLWGAEQTLGAVVLAVPYSAPAGNGSLAAKTSAPGLAATPAGWTYFLPGAVQWRGSLAPERRHRGLFEVTLYEARLSASGWFARPDPAALGVKPEQIDWAEARVLLLVADPRGLQERPVLRWAGRERPFVPGLTAMAGAFGSTLQAALATGDLDGNRIPFSLTLAVRGSEALHLLPLGDDTTAELSSPWPHPSFAGAPLPRTRTADSARGFTASWSVPYFGRMFPQQWRGDLTNVELLGTQLADSKFGVTLLRPADPYQQTERAVKYAVLFILLTFTTVFVLELLSPVRLHPMQYLLVGAALCLFYLLLLALAEHLGMGRAYGVATAATVALVTLYARAVLAGWARAVAIGGVLAGLYGWLYTVLRAEDYALLLGALGLFGTLAVVMFLTRRLDWATLRFRQPAVG